ncbi:hypothetical protein FH975_10250 [Nesterenkonia sp. Hz 6-5]|nr:hypothetical protein [Nesterenkonia haasae]
MICHGGRTNDSALKLRNQHRRVFGTLGHTRQVFNVEVLSPQVASINIGSNGEIPYARILLGVGCADQNRL